MAYNNNPRKVYGKVEIIYSDTDISSISNVNVSGNAPISHPAEVYGAVMSPTVKACTMDGNSTMDGTYQMMDNSCIIGWWSDEASDDDGVFATPPTLEIFFTQRPIISWIISGDNKLNQCPEDFSIQYKNGDTILRTENVYNNEEIQYRLFRTVPGVTSIKLIIYRWNTPNACVKLLRFFDTLVETYNESDLQDFEVNEEMCSEDSSFNISSDSMSVTIYNKEKKFTTGYLKDLLILDRKVRPYIGTEVDGQIVYTSLGTFYSEEWKVSDDGRWVTCSAVDKLMRLQNILYIGKEHDYEITLYDIVEDIFVKAGIPGSRYCIAPELEDIIIEDAFMPKSSVWDALQQIAYTGLCNIYIDRMDRIMVTNIDELHQVSTIALNRNNMFSVISNISLTEFANKVSVDYAETSLGEEAETVAETSITLAGNEELEVIIDYSKEVIYGSIICDNSNIQIISRVGGIDACKVKFRNLTGTTQIGNILIYGSALTINYKTISVEDELSVRDFGAFEYKLPSSDLIQDSVRAREVATKLLNRMKAGEGTISATWRGDPALELSHEYTCTRDVGDENTLICESNKITFDGSLKQVTRGRKIGGQ